MMEQTLVLLKHDAVQRGIVGRIISRFEEAGLKIVALKMIWADEAKAKEHYPVGDEEWAKNLFEKTKKGYEKEGKAMPYKNHKEHGAVIQKFLVEYLREGPIMAIVIEGPHAIELIRKMVGHTEPRQAAPGTIRGDLSSVESYVVADNKQRAVRNLIHASDTPQNAKREIATWFTQKEIYSYKKELDKHF